MPRRATRNSLKSRLMRYHRRYDAAVGTWGFRLFLGVGFGGMLTMMVLPEGPRGVLGALLLSWVGLGFLALGVQQAIESGLSALDRRPIECLISLFVALFLSAVGVNGIAATFHYW